MNNELQKGLEWLSECAIRYQEFWGEKTEFLDIPIENKENLWDRKNMNVHLTSVAILLDYNQSNVLLIDHRFIKKKLAPGGHCDPFELPFDSAKRELEEETGIRNSSIHPWHLKEGIPIDMDYHNIPNRPEKKEASHYHIDFRYLFIAPPQFEIEIQTSEIEGFKFYQLSELKNEYLNVFNKINKLL